MSMPSVVLTCDACGISANTSMLHQSFRYWYKDTEVLLPRSLGFCLDCNNFSPIEDFDQYIGSAIESVESHAPAVIKMAQRILSFLPFAFMRKRRQHSAQELISNAYFLAIAHTRRGDERCMCCLSRNIFKFDGNGKIRYDRTGVYLGSSATAFVHPGCGGKFVAEASPFRFIMARHPRYFEVNGMEISQLTEEVSGS